jgi:GDP-L-fucose synthase
MKHYSGEDFLNIGTGEDITIADFACLVAEVVGYEGAIAFDPSRPDGTPRKLLDVSKLAGLGWRAKTPLRDGLKAAYADFCSRAGGGTQRKAPRDGAARRAVDRTGAPSGSGPTGATLAAE